MVHLEAITEDNFQACLNLDAGLSQQQGFVDSVTYSLAEAWLNRDFQPWALYQEDDLIGFVSLYVGDQHYQIINFLLDQTYQGRGLGKQAAQVCLTYLKQHYGARQISLPVHLENSQAFAFWQGLGFQASTSIEDGYVFMRLT